MRERIKTYQEFWPFYLSQHRKPATQLLHTVGLMIGIFVFVVSLWRGIYWAMPLALVIGYGLAWYSHFFIEKNRPATFQYPLWSFISDFRLPLHYLRSFLKGT